MKTIKNGGTKSCQEVAADWKKNPSDATMKFTTEPSSIWARNFVEKAKKESK